MKKCYIEAAQYADLTSLSFIHLLASEFTSGFNVLKAFHQVAISLNVLLPIKPQPNRREQPAGDIAFLAIAKEEITTAGGAEIANEDIGAAEAGGEELRAIGLAQIEANIFGRRLVAWRHHVEPLQRIRFFAGAQFVEIFFGVGELRCEFGNQLCADFIATATDGRAERGENVSWICAETHAHFSDGFSRDASEGSAPAGVDGGDGALLLID